MKKLIFVLILCLSQIVNICAQVVSSGKASVLINNKAKPEVKQNAPIVFEPNIIAQSVAAPELPIGGGKYYALIIGINNYSDPTITELDYPIRDAEMFYNTLTTRYTFEKENVKFLKNATYSDIVNALDYFAKAVRKIDNFLIFYAGHGYGMLPRSLASGFHQMHRKAAEATGSGTVHSVITSGRSIQNTLCLSLMPVLEDQSLKHALHLWMLQLQ